jgi:hypothetical protein
MSVAEFGLGGAGRRSSRRRGGELPPRHTTAGATPRTTAEKTFLSLGPLAEAFLKGAAAAGVAKLGAELEILAGLEAAHGRPALLAALERATAFQRWRAADVRSILAAGARPTPCG